MGKQNCDSIFISGFQHIFFEFKVKTKLNVAHSFDYYPGFWGKILKGHWTSITYFYLFKSNSMAEFKANQYQHFPPILLMRFHFIRYFVNSIIFRVSQVFTEVDFKKKMPC